MTIQLNDGTIALIGDCYVEDAEPLLGLLHDTPAATVDISALGVLHTAVLQVLLAFRPMVKGPASDEFVRKWVMPLLASGDHE